jgi:hypothetical protein
MYYMVRRRPQWMQRDPRWELLGRATPRLIERFNHLGVVRIEYVAAFPDQDDFSVWLCTETDEQRDRLGTEQPLLDQVRQVLRGAGFTARQVALASLTAQSQETVDRSYEGSWFYALR